VSDVLDAVGDLLEGVGDLVSDAFEAVGDVIQGIGDVILDAVEFVGETVTAIIEDPLPTLLQIGGSMIGIPPYVTAAVITGARGGDLEDIAKSAALSYASTELLSNTQLGADIKNYTVNQFAGDFTDTMMENFNLTADQAVQVSRVATASLNSSLVGGINAALSGNSVMDGIASGFTSGLVYSSTDSYFDSLNKDPNWGFSPQALNLMKGATSTALNTVVSGRGDPSQAVGNYIAYAAINLGTSKILQNAKDAYNVFTTNTAQAEAAQDKYTTAKAEYDTKVKDGEKLRNEINQGAEEFKSIIDNQFTPFKTAYDEVVGRRDGAINDFNYQKKLYEDNKVAYNNYHQHLINHGYQYAVDPDYGWESYMKPINPRVVWEYDPDYGSYPRYLVDGYEEAPSKKHFLDTANAAAAATNAAAARANTANADAEALIRNNQPMLDTLESKKTEIEAKQKQFDVIKADVEAPNAEGTNTAAKLKAAANEYQTKYDAWARTKEAADRSAENYTKALAEVATRDALIDTLNSGSLKVTSKDANGNWQLSNGMTLTTQGKFIQDGVQVFANAAGIPQKVMDFTANDGSNVDFDDNAGRVMSETDVATIAKRDFGFEPTDEETAALAGGVYTNQVTAPITELATKKARDTYFAVTGKEPTASELEQFRRSGNVIDSAADAGINGLDLPPNYISPGASVNQKISFGQAYAANRLAYGNGAVFEWNGKQYTTENKQEQTTRLDKYLEDAQNRINLMPSVEIAGAGRGFLGGPPAGVENIYYGKKDDNVYIDTRTFDAMGNVTGGSLRLADDKTATNIRATNVIEQLAATGAQGLGDLLKSYASAMSLASGSNMDSVTYRLGKTIEQWGKDRDGADVVKQTDNMKSAVEAASKEGNFFKQGQMILKAAADNPIGMISFFGKEAVQETPGWALGALAAAGVAVFGGGVGAVALTGAALAAAIDGLEAFGSGGREAYDALKKAGVPEELARDKAIINGSIHAAVVAPAEFIADKTLFKAYLNSVSGGIKEYAAKYGSTIATNAAAEFISTVPSVLSTQAITTGKTDLRTATAEAWFSSIIGAGTVTTVLGPAAINDAVVIAKDYAGNDVTLAEFMSGSRDVNLATLDSSATIGTMENGGQMTVGALAATGTDLGLSPAELKTFLPSSITDYGSVVYKSASGTPITLGNIDSMVAKNPALDFTTVLDTVYKTGASDFNVVFSPSVLNGTAPLKSATDYEATALSQGFPNYASYQQYGGDLSLYQNAQNNSLATSAGFPDFATYTAFNGDKAAYDASKVTPPVVTPPTVTPPTVTPPVVTPPAGGVTMDAVDTAIRNAIESIQLPAGVNMDSVVTAIRNFAAQNPSLNSSDVTAAIANYMKSNPPVSMADVSTAMSTATKGLATKADIATAIAGIKIPEGISVADVSKAIEDYMSKNPRLSAAEVTAAVKTYMDNNPGLVASDVKAAVESATKDFATKKDIEAAIADAKAAGLSGDQALRSAIDAVAAEQNTSAANLLSKIGATEASLKTEFAAGLAGVQADISNVQKNLQDAMAANEAAGLSRDQAAAKAISDVAASVGTTKEALLAQMGVNEASLRSDLASGLAGVSQNVAAVEARIEAAMKVNQQAGMDANAALNKAINDVSGSLNTTRDDLLTRLGQTEQSLQQQLSAGLTGVEQKLNAAMAANEAAGMSRDQALNKAVEDVAASVGTNRAELLAQLGETEQSLRAQFNLGQQQTTEQIANVQAQLTSAMQANEAAGLSRDQAAAKAIQDVAASVGTTKDAMLAQLGQTEASLQQQLTAGLAGVTQDFQQKYEALSAAQKAQFDAMVEQGQNINTAMQAVQSGLQQQVTDVEARINAAIAANEAAGMSRNQALTKAIDDVAASAGQTKADLLAQLGQTESGLRQEIAASQSQTQNQIASLSAQTQAQYAAMTAAQQAEVQARVAQGETLQNAITASQQEMQQQSLAQYNALSAAQKAEADARIAQGQTLQQAIAAAQQETAGQIAGLTAQTQAQYAAMTAAQQAEVQARVAQGETLQNAITASQQATQEQITQTQQQAQAQYNALSAAQKAEADARIAQGQTLQEAIAASQQTSANQIAALSQQTQQQYAALTAAQKAEVDLRVQQGVDLQTAIADSAKATTEQIGKVKTDLTKNITDVQTQFNARVDELVLQGKTYQEATDSALKELGTGFTGLQTGFDEYKKQQEAAAKEAALQAKRATSTSNTARNLAGALSMIAPAAGAAGLADNSTPGFKDIGLKTTGEAKFEGLLDSYLKMVKENTYVPKQAQQESQQQNQQAAPMQDELSAQQQQPQQGSDYFNYGQQTDINDLLDGSQGNMPYYKSGGLATPLFAGGGTTRHGRYAGGGLNVVEHAGKARLDFRSGDAVTGPGDGQSDDIPAMLADGEFVFPADVVAALGNGSTKAGSDKLYDMMHSIRAYHRSAKPKDLPPPAKKSPLDYLKKPARKARR
jgi:hypothetical protein